MADSGPKWAGVMWDDVLSTTCRRVSRHVGPSNPIHIFRFAGWTTEEEAALPAEEQIQRLARELFAGPWKELRPETCVAETPFGLFVFSAQREPTPLPRSTFGDRPFEAKDRPLICGFLKARNEVIREGNIHRVLRNLRRFCDVIVACDDGSADGTAEILSRRADHVIVVSENEHDFCAELRVKQRMLDLVHEKIKPVYVWWADSDEELSDEGCENIRCFCEAEAYGPHEAFRFAYDQLWRGADWARTDGDFDKGRFIKLWRWNPELRFGEHYGTHGPQMPLSILESGLIGEAPWHVIHRGNYGKNLVLKCAQYWGGLGDVARHMDFEDGTYRPVSPEAHLQLVEKPQPFSIIEKQRIRAMENLAHVPRTFCVVVPTYNRATYLPEALASLIKQTYERWIAVVIDDGSTDETAQVMRRWQHFDPRIFYVRNFEHRGAVAANEIGMALACQMTEWWTRLGSDDYFEPAKLTLDALALEAHEVCYGPYRVLRRSQLSEYGNGPLTYEEMREQLTAGKFVVSWANIAARTDVLAKIRDKYGGFCDSRLHTMEDFLVNARMASITDNWAWRGRRCTEDVHVGAKHACGWPSGFVHDAVWRCSATGSASADGATTRAEHELTQRIIRSMTSQAPPATLAYTKAFWRRAAGYPVDKEAHYPKHAAASGFDSFVDLHILEYGCGAGSDALSLLRRGNGVTYCDIVPENVQEATRRIEAAGLSKRAHPCVLEDSLLTAVESGSHDLVYSHGVIHHIEEPLPVLREFVRVLRPKSRVIVMLYTEQLAGRHAMLVDELMRKGFSREQAFGAATDSDGCPYAKAYSEAEGRALFESAGLVVTETRLYNDDCFRVFFARSS